MDFFVILCSPTPPFDKQHVQTEICVRHLSSLSTEKNTKYKFADFREEEKYLIYNYRHACLPSYFYLFLEKDLHIRS